MSLDHSTPTKHLQEIFFQSRWRNSGKHRDVLLFVQASFFLELVLGDTRYKISSPWSKAWPWEWEAALCVSSSFILIFQACSFLTFHTLEEKILDGWPRGLFLSFMNSSSEERFDLTRFSFSLNMSRCFHHHPIIPCNWTLSSPALFEFLWVEKEPRITVLELKRR